MNASLLPKLLRRTRIAFALAAFAGSSAMALADQTYPIRLQLSQGDKWSFDTSTSMKEKGAVMANGQVAQPIDQSMQQRRKGTIEILAVENGLPTSMTVIYDRESNNGAGAGPDGKPAPAFALAGRTVHLTKKNGTVTTDLGNDADPQVVQEVSHMLDPDTSIYPKAPVAINETWNGDTASMSKEFQLNPGDKVDMKCILTGVHDVGGRSIADVGITGSLTKHDQGFVETTITLEGMTHIDLKTGQPLDSSMDGKLASRGQQQSPGPDGNPVNVSVQADGTLSVRQSVRMIAGADAVAGGGFDTTPAPAPQPPAPDAPFVQIPLRGGFAGSFKGDQIALDLAEDSGKYTGSLTVGEKKYPVTASADGNKLTGVFESDGAKFNFSASLAGGSMTLTSEGNTYTLKKPAGNPLARPPAKNPLAQ